MPVLAAYEHGGWKEVGKLYSNPPASTEQVLHPETKLYPKRDNPKRVTLPALADHEVVYENVMGELQWRVYFMLWKKEIGDKRSLARSLGNVGMVHEMLGDLTAAVATHQSATPTAMASL